MLNNCKNVFIVYSQTAFIPPKPPSRGYAGHTGRLDVLLRSIIVTTMCQDCCFIGFLGGLKEGKNALLYNSEIRVRSEKELYNDLLRCTKHGSCKYVELVQSDYTYLLQQLKRKGYHVLLLTEKGTDYCDRKTMFSTYKKKAFILGSHLDLPADIYNISSKYAEEISISPKSLHTSHVILFLVALIERTRKANLICQEF